MKLLWNKDESDSLEGLDLVALERQVIEDLEHMEIESPEGLFFHTIFLGKDYDGPSVQVFGGEGVDFFELIYTAQTKWESLADWEKEDGQS